MNATLLSATSLVALTLPAAGVEVLQTGRFSPDPPPVPGPPSLDFLGSPIAIGAGLAVVGETVAGELYVHDVQTGERVSKITPASGAVPSLFGQALAVEGSTAVVGAEGSAYLYNIQTGNRIRRLIPSTPIPSRATFGRSVAIGDGIALVAATTNPFGPTSSERVYAFNTTTGQEIATFDSTVPGSNFGLTLGVADGVAVIAAPRDGEAGENAGAAYLFDVASGNQITKLIGPSSESYFGAGVAIDGDRAFVAEPLSANGGVRQVGVYKASTGARLGSVQTDSGAFDPSFGSFLAADSGRLLVGSVLEDSGYAYLFDTSSRQQIARFTPSDGPPFFEFGWGVALSGNFAGVIDPTAGAYTFFLVPEPTGALLASLAMTSALIGRRR